MVFTVEYFLKNPYMWVPMDSVSGAEALGPHRVRIKLKKAYSPFLTYVAGTMPIIPRHVWEGVADPKSYNDPKSFYRLRAIRFQGFQQGPGILSVRGL